MKKKPDSSSAFASEVIAERFSVPVEYPVYFARDVFNQGNPLLATAFDRLNEGRRHRAAAYVDSGLAEARPRLIEDIKDYFHALPENLELAAPPVVVRGGERAKTGWDVVRDVMSTAGNLHLDRQSFVLAVGGGAMLDMVGFAASIVHRGLRLIRVPTTTLAQCDAGIGVKNGMNEHGQKNFVGTFTPPFAVLNDAGLWDTLKDRDWLGGAAEAFKVAIIKDAAFFESLCRQAAALRARDAAAMEATVRRCAELHLEHIRTGGDPFEMGSARPLDFGHWSAHKLEVMSDYALGHGQAVSIGIALDCCIAAARELMTAGERDQVCAAMIECGLPVWCEHLHERGAGGELRIIDGLHQFREHLGGVLTVTLPRGIGDKVEVHHVDAEAVAAGVEFLRELDGGRGT